MLTYKKKSVFIQYQVHHLNWVENYQKLRTAISIEWPGYVLHESGCWSPIHRKWYFLPRRCSKERYNETKVRPKSKRSIRI